MVMQAEKKLTRKQTIARYRDYVDCFNSKDFEGLKKYLSEDLFFYRAPMPSFLGRAAMFAFYKEAWTHFNERVTIEEIHFKEIDPEVPLVYFVASIVVHLQIFSAWIDGPWGTYLTGTEKHVAQKIFYGMDQEGVIAVIM